MQDGETHNDVDPIRAGSPLVAEAVGANGVSVGLTFQYKENVRGV